MIWLRVLPLIYDLVDDNKLKFVRGVVVVKKTPWRGVEPRSRA